MRYLTLHEAFIIGEAVTGIDAKTLTSISRLDLLDSAVRAPQAGFADQEFFSDFFLSSDKDCLSQRPSHRCHDSIDLKRHRIWSAKCWSTVSTCRCRPLLVDVSSLQWDKGRNNNLNDTDVRTLAMLCKRAFRDGAPPTKKFQQWMGCSKSTASRAVKQARDAGFLGQPSKKGLPSTPQNNRPS